MRILKKKYYFPMMMRNIIIIIIIIKDVKRGSEIIMKINDCILDLLQKESINMGVRRYSHIGIY